MGTPTTNPTTITADMPARPIDDPGDWNWADAASDAWVAAARSVGLDPVIVDFDSTLWDVDYATVADLVQIDGTTYRLDVVDVADLVRCWEAQPKEED